MLGIAPVHISNITVRFLSSQWLLGDRQREAIIDNRLWSNLGEKMAVLNMYYYQQVAMIANSYALPRCHSSILRMVITRLLDSGTKI